MNQGDINVLDAALSRITGAEQAHKPLRLTVITTEYGAAVNAGGGVGTICRTFDLPKEVSDYIQSQRGPWSTVTLGIECEA